MESIRITEPIRWGLLHREGCKGNIVWLLSEILSTRFWMHPEDPGVKLFLDEYMVEMAFELDAEPTSDKGDLFIYPRGYGKSTIHTFAKPIKTVLNNPTATCGIISLHLDLAQAFLGQISTELIENQFLVSLFDEIFYSDPLHQAPQHSIKDGITVKRPDLNYKDPTFQALGLLDSSNQGKRISDAFYDDVVNERVTDNPKMTEKANKRWEMSLRLGMPGTKRSYVGTFYAAGDTYHHMVEHGVALHFHSCYVVNESSSQFSKDGIPMRLVVDREQPLLRSKEYLKSEEEQGAKTFAIQMLGIPTAAEVTDFNTDLICRYYVSPKKVREGQNVIFVIDPAGRRGDESHSRFAMGIFGMHYDENYYLLDGVLDRLNLGQRIDVIFKKHKQWRPIEVRYEANGYNADIEAVEMAMQYRNYRFIITPVFPQGTTKKKRVERLIPIIGNRRMYVPDEGISYLMLDNNQLVDIVDWWITKELMPFPNVGHLDFSDAASRLEEPGHVNLWPAAPPAPQDPWRLELDEHRQNEVLDWMRM
jgi:hypothetical protein